MYYLNLHAASPLVEWDSWDISSLGLPLKGDPSLKVPQGSGSRNLDLLYPLWGIRASIQMYREMPGKVLSGPAPISDPGNVEGKIQVPQQRTKPPPSPLHLCTCHSCPPSPSTQSSGGVPTSASCEGGQIGEGVGRARPRPRGCPDVFIFIGG